MAATPPPMPRTVEEIFNDFKGRRAGLVKALTVDFRQFYLQCAPGRENICLYGLPNETWEVKPPVEKVPPELPEPAVRINFGRRGIPGKDWLSRVAAHSDSWLLSVAFYYGGISGFGKSQRGRLFEMITDYTTVHEEVKQWTSLCGACGEEKAEENEFWICCKVCDKWFHGKCVKITPPQAQHINQYKCPTCSQ